MCLKPCTPVSVCRGLDVGIDLKLGVTMGREAKELYAAVRQLVKAVSDAQGFLNGHHISHLTIFHANGGRGLWTLLIIQRRVSTYEQGPHGHEESWNLKLSWKVMDCGGGGSSRSHGKLIFQGKSHGKVMKFYHKPLVPCTICGYGSLLVCIYTSSLLSIYVI